MAPSVGTEPRSAVADVPVWYKAGVATTAVSPLLRLAWREPEQIGAAGG
jgi:hypothetical protein